MLTVELLKFATNAVVPFCVSATSTGAKAVPMVVANVKGVILPIRMSFPNICDSATAPLRDRETPRTARSDNNESCTTPSGCRSTTRGPDAGSEQAHAKAAAEMAIVTNKRLARCDRRSMFTRLGEDASTVEKGRGSARRHADGHHLQSNFRALAYLS